MVRFSISVFADSKSVYCVCRYVRCAICVLTRLSVHSKNLHLSGCVFTGNALSFFLRGGGNLKSPRHHPRDVTHCE